MNERKLNWNYPLLKTTENKSGSRTSVPKESAYEVVGADCSTKTGIRPFPGFKKVHEFSSLDGEANHSTSSRITDVFPISFRVGTDQYGFGFIYRAVRPLATHLSDIFIDFRILGYDSGNWQRGETIKLAVASADPMEVVSFGRYIYTMVKGVEPILFYVNYVVRAAATASLTIANDSQITQGDTVTLIPADGSPTSHVITANDTLESDSFPYKFDIGNGSADATELSLRTVIDAQDDYTAEEVPTDNTSCTVTQTVLGSAGNTTIVLSLANAGCITKTNFTGGAGIAASDYEVVIEEDTGPGLQPKILSPEDDTAIGSLPIPDNGAPGNVHVFVSEGIGSYWDSSPAPQLQTDLTDFKAGNYAVAYVLEDPDTGRKTSLSEVAQVKEEQIVTAATGTIQLITDTNDKDDLHSEFIVINDGINAAVTFTFEGDSAGDTSGSGTAYTVNIEAASTDAEFADELMDAINLANTNNDLKITATRDDFTLTLTHDENTLDGNSLMSTSDSTFIKLTGMAGSTELSPANIGVEIVYDATKFSRAYIYRSVRVQDAGGAYSASIVQLDQIITLNDYIASDQTGTGIVDGDYVRAFYYFTLDDLALIYQDPYTDRSIFDENMPKAGTATEFDGILLSSNIEGDGSVGVSDEDRPLDKFRGLGEFRWSSIRETSPELFPPENYYVPSKISNQVITFEKSGGAVLGFGNNVVMHITRETTGTISYLKVLPIHEGYGLVDKKAVKSVGPHTFYVNDKGLKSIDAQGRLDSLHALDGVIDGWSSNFSDLSIAYDSQSSVLFILNPTLKEAVLMWFSTSMISELHDMPFDLVKTGQWYSDLSDEDSDLTERAFFLQNQPDAGTANDDFDACLWVMDSKRESVIAGATSGNSFNGQSRITLLHHTGDTRFKVASATSSTVTISEDTTHHGGVKPTLVFANAEWAGAFIYIIASADETKIGEKAQIRSISGLVITVINKSSGFSPVAGDRLGLSPIYVRWAGSLLGYNDPLDPQNPTPSGLHVIRLIDSLSTYFSEVSGAPTTDTVDTADLVYTGLLFEGDSDTAVSDGIPKNLSGTIVKSINAGESTNWVSFEKYGVRGVALSPGVEVFCPDLDFRLLSVIIEGKLLPTLRTERST